MNLEELHNEAIDSLFTAVYDLAEKRVTLRWRENYSDADEADFFGNQATEGQSIGVRFYDVCDFRTSVKDHVFLGTLRKLELNCVNDDISVNIRYETESSGSQWFEFLCSNVDSEHLIQGRIDLRSLEPIRRGHA